MLTIIIVLAIGTLYAYIRDLLRALYVKRFWKKWEDNSFEWGNGWRLNKDYYEIVNGELKERKPNGKKS